MTYGVPYSFVPGTKAKADEVNANFIDVIDKIEETNNRINETNNRIDETNSNLEASDSDTETKLSQKANLSLSNLDANGRALFDAKANLSALDGQWINSYKSLATEVSMNVNTTNTYSLDDYFPDSTSKYEVLVGGTAQTAGANGNQALVLIRTDYMPQTSMHFIRIRSQAASVIYGCESTTLVTSTGRKLYINLTSSSNGAARISLALFGYRKVR